MSDASTAPVPPRTTHAGRAARFGAIVALALGLAVLAPGAPARADDFTRQANAAYLVIRGESGREFPLPQDQRSDLVVLPAVAGMQPPPPFLAERLPAILLPPTSRDWAAAAAWAQAPAQRAALEALAKATENEDPERHMAFAQPYGVEGVPIELVSADLYTELGDPPLLAAAEFKYLRKLTWLAVLAHVEANRLLAEGKGSEALEVLVDLVFFGRQVADRQLAPEMTWGLETVALGLEHLRDVAYRDLKAPARTIPIETLKTVVRRLDDRRGPLGLERLRPPGAARLAGEQLLYYVYDASTGAPNADRYSTLLANITTADRPLRLFAEAAVWEQARASAANLRQTREVLGRVHDDFVYRWGLRAHDPTMATEPDYRKTVEGRPGMKVLELLYGRFQDLFVRRQDLRVEAAGTRMSLAMDAYFLQNNTYPSALTAVRPVFAPVIDKDPYSAAGRDMEYFVPGRDQPRGPQGQEVLHEMRVFPPAPYKPFAVKLDSKDFVIYSVGADGDRGWARDVTMSTLTMTTGDLVAWPPVPSLLRQYLVQERLLP
jgi:hypothetical protein